MMDLFTRWYSACSYQRLNYLCYLRMPAPQVFPSLKLANLPVVSADSLASAKIASLRYVSDAMPGIRRIRKSKGFVYLGIDGEVVRDPVQRRRIKSLAIPPAWTDVWICSREDGHLQATWLRCQRPKTAPIPPAMAGSARRE